MVQEDVEKIDQDRPAESVDFHDPGLVMRSFSMRDGESLHQFFEGFPYFVADNIGSFEDHDAVRGYRTYGEC